MNKAKNAGKNTQTTVAAPFNTDRTHTVGLFLAKHPDAKRVVAGNRAKANREFYHCGEENRASFNGGVRRGSMLGRGTGFDISVKARAV